MFHSMSKAGSEQLSGVELNGHAPEEETPVLDARVPVVGGLDLAGPAVPAHLPWHAEIKQSAAFALSALLSPYLVIPVGTFVIVLTQPASWSQLLRWTFVSIFFSTVVPAIYVSVQVLRGAITDVHVMERDQRDGPFIVAIASSFVGAAVLWQMRAPPTVWGLGVMLAANGVVLFLISNHWKISMHVAVLAATVFAGMLFIDGISPWNLLWLIPALIWARVTRKRHTVWQGLAACVVAWVMTGGVLYFINQGSRFINLLQRMQ